MNRSRQLKKKKKAQKEIAADLKKEFDKIAKAKKKLELYAGRAGDICGDDSKATGNEKEANCNLKAFKGCKNTSDNLG